MKVNSRGKYMVMRFILTFIKKVEKREASSVNKVVSLSIGKYIPQMFSKP
jgi:hypothetical protein